MIRTSALIFAALAGGLLTPFAAAQERNEVEAGGFYGGVALRNGGVALSVPKLSPSLAKYFSP